MTTKELRKKNKLEMPFYIMVICGFIIVLSIILYLIFQSNIQFRLFLLGGYSVAIIVLIFVIKYIVK